MKPLAVILIVIGAFMMIITGVNFVTKDKVVDLGKVEIDKTRNHPVNWSPIVGGVLLLAGIGALAMSKKKIV